MIAKLSEMGVTSEMAYAAGTASIGLSFLTWALSKKKEDAGTDRASHIFRNAPSSRPEDQRA
jgi:hypothetical protein